MGQTKVSTRIYLALGAVVVFTVVLAAVTVIHLRTLGEELEAVIRQTAVRLDLVHASQASAWKAETYKRGVYLAATLKKPDMARDFERRCMEALQELRRQLQQLDRLMDAEGRGPLDRLQAASQSHEPLLREFLRAALSERFQEIEPLVGKIEPLVDAMDEAGTALAEQQRQSLQRTMAADAALVRRAFWWTAVLLALILAAGTLAMVVVRGVNSSLRRAVEELADGSRQMSASAQQVSSSAQALSQAASQQAASLEETSASTQEIQAMTRRNLENAQQAASTTREAVHDIQQADLALQAMTQSMNDIVSSSGKISKIIQVIDEIAFQTNILALNAAVEAARAGEAGMGFAVVADEVRNLAQRCAQAAKDTTSLIEESIALSQAGKAKVAQVVSSISSVTAGSAKVQTLAEEVKVSSEEQARGMEQIAKAVIQMEQVTQRVAAHAEEGAAAGQELSSQAALVGAVVEQLARMVGSGGGGNFVGTYRARPSRPAGKPKTPAEPAPVSAVAPAHPPNREGDWL